MLFTDFSDMGNVINQTNLSSAGVCINCQPKGNARVFTDSSDNYIKFINPKIFPTPIALGISSNLTLDAYIEDGWITGGRLKTPKNYWHMVGLVCDATAGKVIFYENDQIVYQYSKTLAASQSYFTWVMRNTDTIGANIRYRIFDRYSATAFCIGQYVPEKFTRWQGQIGGFSLVTAGNALTYAEVKEIYTKTKPLMGSLAYNYPYDRSYPLFIAGAGTQGLTTDGVNWFWGVDNGSAVDGSIKKLNLTTGAVEATYAAPPHAAGGDWRENHDTIIFSSGGTDTPDVWEINKNDGTKIRSWDFAGIDYNRGALVAWESGDSIYLFTSDGSYNFKIRQITINDDETFTLGNVWSSPSMGLPQGLDHKDGFLYYLSDHVSPWTTGKISKLCLNDNGSITVIESWLFEIGTESEGFTFLGDDMYYGDLTRRIHKVMPR